MPRVARKKTADSIFHIMSRSISEIDLFKCDDDKHFYMQLIKKYQNTHKFNVYCYCLMKNHAHLIIDANGADISQFMHGINFSYAIYYNDKYERHGHLFQDRFKSKIISDYNYLIVASAYIHNNPTAISEYSSHPDDFKFSSLSVYLGKNRDPYELIDYSFVLSLFGDDYKSARKRYLDFVYKCDNPNLDDIEFENEGTLYCSQRKPLIRNANFKEILDYVSKVTNTPKAIIFTKHNKNATEARALLVLLLKCFCNYNSTDVCSTIGNIAQANVSRLTHTGLNLIQTNKKYDKIFEEFINPHQI